MTGTVEAQEFSSFAALEHMPLGDSCWLQGFDSWSCCVIEHSDCWNSLYKRERCCFGVDFAITEEKRIVELDSLWVACLAQAASVEFVHGRTTPAVCAYG
eukprot:227305-Amphidinium_carterae.1